MVWPSPVVGSRGSRYRRAASSVERRNTSSSNRGDEVMQVPSLLLQHNSSWGTEVRTQQAHLHQAGGAVCGRGLMSGGQSDVAPDCSRDKAALRWPMSSCNKLFHLCVNAKKLEQSWWILFRLNQLLIVGNRDRTSYGRTGAAAWLPLVVEHLAVCCPVRSSSVTSSRAKCHAHRRRTRGGCTATVTSKDPPY